MKVVAFRFVFVGVVCVFLQWLLMGDVKRFAERQSTDSYVSPTGSNRTSSKKDPLSTSALNPSSARNVRREGQLPGSLMPNAQRPAGRRPTTNNNNTKKKTAPTAKTSDNRQHKRSIDDRIYNRRSRPKQQLG